MVKSRILRRILSIATFTSIYNIRHHMYPLSSKCLEDSEINRDRESEFQKEIKFIVKSGNYIMKRKSN